MDVITFPVNLKTTSGLSILLHGVISLIDATSYDKAFYANHYLEGDMNARWSENEKNIVFYRKVHNFLMVIIVSRIYHK